MLSGARQVLQEALDLYSSEAHLKTLLQPRLQSTQRLGSTKLALLSWSRNANVCRGSKLYERFLSSLHKLTKKTIGFCRHCGKLMTGASKSTRHRLFCCLSCRLECKAYACQLQQKLAIAGHGCYDTHDSLNDCWRLMVAGVLSKS